MEPLEGEAGEDDQFHAYIPPASAPMWAKLLMPLVVVGAVIAALVFMWNAGGPPEKTVAKIMDRLESRTPDSIVGIVVPDQQKDVAKILSSDQSNNTTMQGIVNLSKSLLYLGYDFNDFKLKDRKYMVKSQAWDKAEVTVTFVRHYQYGDRDPVEERFTLTIPLLKVDGKWYVDGNKLNVPASSQGQ